MTFRSARATLKKTKGSYTHAKLVLMMPPGKTNRRWIDPQNVIDLRHRADPKRKYAAELLDVTTRAIRNWWACAGIPWMAYRMLSILAGYKVPGKAWEGWTVHPDRLYAWNVRGFEANSLEEIEQVFGKTRLWRKDNANQSHKTAAKVLAIPDRKGVH